MTIALRTCTPDGISDASLAALVAFNHARDRYYFAFNHPELPLEPAHVDMNNAETLFLKCCAKNPDCAKCCNLTHFKIPVINPVIH